MSGLSLPKSKIAVVSVLFVALLMLLVAFVPQQNSSQSPGVNVPQVPPRTYNVNFTETGFSGYLANTANGWDWYVFVSGVGSNTSSGVTNSFQLRNGTYSFSINYNSAYSYAINPSSGTVYVNGSTNGITVDVTFSNITTPAVRTYDANFTVTNLPAVIPNVTWGYDVTVVGIDVSYTRSSSSSGTTIKFTGLPVGSYEYSVSGNPFGTSLTPVSGSFTISKNVTIDLTFTLLKDYRLNFDSSGLTSTQSFLVTISTGNPSGTSYLESNSSYPSLSYVGFYLPNGTYYYTVSASTNGLSPNPSTGTIDINGGNVVINIQFTTSPKSYSVTFQVVNLPSNLQNYQFGYYVQIDDYYYYLHNFGPTITFSFPNGTYSFGDGFYGPTPPVTLTSGLSPSSGNFVVQGNSVVISLTLLPPQPVYQVKLIESGLPSGQYFSGDVNYNLNATMITSSSNYIGFNLPNGSYEYSINGIHGFGESPSFGQVVVNGASVVIQISFYPGFYVNFTIQNLPANIQNEGFSWAAELIDSANGYTYDQSSSGAKISFSSMSAGVYTYTASTIYGSYQILKPSGTVTVNTTNVNLMLNVSLVKLYTVTFTETGLVPLSGTEWGVVVDNGFVYSSNSLAGFGSFSGVPATMTFTLTLPNGTYSVQGFTVGNSGYTTFTSPQSISVNGKMSNNSVAFSNSAPSTNNNSAAITDTVLGVVGGLAVGIAAVTAFMYFRKKPPAVTPKGE